ncbi:MAG: DUF3037 domain-containing protein [Bacteroidota bacterium]
MQNRIAYEYTIIRVVPKVEREEFLNVGVILYARKKRFLDIRYHIDHERLTTFSKDIDVDLIADYLKAWELVCRGGVAGGSIGQLDMPVRFRWLSANRSTIIQGSKLHTGLCHDPKEALVDIFERYVVL